MQKEDSQNKVENAFRKAVSSDRARIQIANISRFGLLEISRQRLKPSLNETYDIEHVLVRGPRSIGQSILRIIGEDVAKENTAEIQVYVPADVASYLLNEKRRDILSIEDATGVKILIIADPYKSRPYYKVVRIKTSEVKKKSSYDLTPDSPKPDTNWRDEKSRSKLNPLVDATDHKKSHKSGGGILSWIKNLTASSKPTKTKTKKSSQKRRPHKGSYKKKKPSSYKSNSKRKPSSSSAKKPSKYTDKKPKTDSRTKKPQKKAPSSKSKAKSNVDNDTSKRISGRQDIVKKVKTKPEPPTRALNDPRDS